MNTNEKISVAADEFVLEQYNLELAVADIIYLTSLLEKICTSKQTIFKMVKFPSGLYGIQKNKKIIKLLSLIKIIKSEQLVKFTEYNLNPYVELYSDLRDKLQIPDYAWLVKFADAYEEVNEWCIALNNFVSQLRFNAQLDEFKNKLNARRHLINKRRRSLNIYIAALFGSHSRLLVLRIDLAYRNMPKQGNISDQMRVAKRDWCKLYKKMNSGYLVSNLVGYIVKLEYGLLKGPHFHLLLFYSGAQHQQDGTLCNIIGQYWANNITKGNGLYFNCNSKKYKYRKLGIGMINYFDTELIDNLKNIAAEYLIKLDYFFQIKGVQLYRRGNLPKLNRLSLGRPRKHI